MYRQPKKELFRLICLFWYKKNLLSFFFMTYGTGTDDTVGYVCSYEYLLSVVLMGFSNFYWSLKLNFLLFLV